MTKRTDIFHTPDGQPPENYQPRFTGEMMKCIMCGQEQQSDPDVESGWTCVEMDGSFFYVCPREIPKPGLRYKERYTAAWERIFRRIYYLGK